MANYRAIASGNWSSLSTWQDDSLGYFTASTVLPTTNDTVYSNNFTVTIDGTRVASSIRNSIFTSPTTLGAVATATMTSNTTPSGIAAASAAQSPAWQAFDKNTATFWQTPSSGQTGWLLYQFPTGKIIKKYGFNSVATTTINPKTWTFEGSNNGSTWTVLDTQTNFPTQANTFYSFDISSNTTSYTYYRINITATTGGASGIALYEFEMSEVTNLYGNIVAGGQFIFANNGALTCSASPAIVVGVGSVPVLEMTLASPNTATFNGSVLTVPNIVNGLVIRNSGTGILNCNGNYNLDNSFGGRSIISVTSTGTVNIVGDLSSTVSSNNVNTLLMTTAGTINITGNVTGAPSTSGTPLSTSTIFIIGAGNLNITGNTTASLTPAVYLGGAINYTQIGNVNASTTQAAIYNVTAAATISVTGVITAGNGAPAIYSAFALASGYGSSTFVKVSGNVVNNSNIIAIVAPRVTIDTNTSSWLFQISTGGDRTLYAAGVALGNPATSNVRFGTTYGASGELTGTLRVPSAANVLSGVLTDNTTGTLLMTPADFWNYLISSGFTANSIGDRLQNASTVATTGGQIASYNI
jgi:hypothetical protein